MRNRRNPLAFILSSVIFYGVQQSSQLPYRNVLKVKGTEKTIWGVGSNNSPKLVSDDNTATFVTGDSPLLKDDKRAHMLVDLKQAYVIYGVNLKGGGGISLGSLTVYVGSRLSPLPEDVCASKDSGKSGSGGEFVRLVCQIQKCGQYLFIVGGSNGQIAISELEVIASPFNIGLENVAYRKRTDMFPKPSNNKVSDLAVDGNSAQNMDYSFSCSLSEPGVSPWLYVDLNSVYDVKTVVLFGADDDGIPNQMARVLRDIEVRVGFTKPSDDKFSQKGFNTLCGSWVGEPPVTTGPVIVVNCKSKDSDSQNFDNADLAVLPPGNVMYDVTIPQLHKDYRWKLGGMAGRYVIIQMVGKPDGKVPGVLSLCEVEVYGTLLQAVDRGNLASNKRSFDNSAGSIGNGYLPILANDGSKGSVYCYYGTNIADPTWTVHLGSVYEISYFVITKGIKDYQWDYVQLRVGFSSKNTDNSLCNSVNDNSKAVTLSIKCLTPKRGEYAGVTKVSASNSDNGKSLELCEVELYGRELNLGSNFAYGSDRTATQSSVASVPKYVSREPGPRLAIDGNAEWSLATDGSGRAIEYCSETGPDPKKGNFWMIDLKSFYKIEAVLINGGGDTGGVKLESYTVYYGLDETASLLFSVYKSTPLGSWRYHTINVTKPGDKDQVIKDGKLARFIKIVPTKNEYGPSVLRLCEVEIYGLGNVALKSPAFQSGVNPEQSTGTADKANDGTPIPSQKKPSCVPIMTKSVVNPFWAVQLDGIYRVGYIDVINRNDAKYTLLQNLYTSVGFYGLPSLNKPCGSPFLGPPPVQGHVYQIRCAAYKEAYPRGKFAIVYIEDPKAMTLSVCEVSVYGEKEILVNVAKGEQSLDNQNSAYAMLANDGLYLTDANLGYCLTLKGAKSWWRLNLRDAHRIDYANVWQASGNAKSFNVFAGFKEEASSNKKCTVSNLNTNPTQAVCVDLSISPTLNFMGSIHGHYVFLEAGEGDFKVCEVEVFGEALGLGKKVKPQLSSLSSQPESKGLEKVFDGLYFSNCLNIGPDKKPWWMVKFESIYSIHQIDVYGPIDCCWPFEPNMITRVGHSKDLPDNAICWDMLGKSSSSLKMSSPCFAKLINGLYASIELNDKAGTESKLTFCQVEIFGYATNFSNLITGSSTWVDQSSTFNPAELAVDHILDGGICASTTVEMYPFWRAHFTLPYMVEGFAIYVGKSDVSRQSLDGLWVTAGFINDPFLNPVCYKAIRPHLPKDKDSFVTRCQEALPATYFNVISDSKYVGKTALKLCEVEIYGTPSGYHKFIQPKEIKASSGGPWINAINGDIKDPLAVYKYGETVEDEDVKDETLESPSIPLACVQSGPERQAWIRVYLGRDHIVWNVLIYQYTKFPFPRALISLSYNDSLQNHAICGHTGYQSSKFLIVVNCKVDEEIFQKQSYNIKRTRSMGCFNLGPLSGDKSEFQLTIDPDDSPTSPKLTDNGCAEACYGKKFKYSATTMGACFCSNNIGIYGRPVNEKACDTPCPGNKGHSCGGKQSFSAYYTGYKPKWTSQTYPIGRYLIVRTDSTLNTILAVCELEIYGQPILFSNLNIAHGKPSTMDTAKNNELSYTNYELKSHLYSAKGLSCLILPKVSSPWYMVNLLAIHTIIGAYVSTYFGDDYNSNFWEINTWERYERYEFRVGHTPYPSQNELCYSSNLRIFTATCPSIRGSYVSLQLMSQAGESDQLIVCSFHVYGEPSDLTPSNVAYFKHALSSDGFATLAVDGSRGMSNSQCHRVSKGPAIWTINLRATHRIASYNVLFDSIKDAVETYVGHYPNYWNGILCSSVKPEPKSFLASKCTRKLSGKYFIIYARTQATQDVSLCEIEVYGYSIGVNVAREAPKTSQSQTETRAESRLAVDGKKTYTYSAYISVCSSTTSAIKDPWWSVNLESIFIIDHIQVTRRKESCGLNAAKIHKFQFRVGFDKLHWRNPLCSEYEGRMHSTDGTPIIVECVSGVSGDNPKYIYDATPFLGQYVGINLVSPALTDIEKLTLCEVEVFANDVGFVQLRGSNKLMKDLGCFATIPGQESTFKPQQITVEDGRAYNNDDPDYKDASSLTKITNSICNRECLIKGKAYSATKGGSVCLCGEDLYNVKMTSTDGGECDVPCIGNRQEICGGQTTMSISPTTLENGAYGRTSYMVNGESPIQITDGITDPYRVGSCVAWSVSVSPWWKIELASVHIIIGVVIVLHPCCYQNFKDFEIRGGFDTIDPVKNNFCYKSLPDQPYGSVNLLKCDHPLIASSMSVHIKQDVNVCEVITLGHNLNMGYNVAYGKSTRCGSSTIPDNTLIVHDGCRDYPEARYLTDGNPFMYSCFVSKPIEKLLIEIDLNAISVVKGVIVYNPLPVEDKSQSKMIHDATVEARLRPAGSFDWPFLCGKMLQTYTGQMGFVECKNSIAKYITIRVGNTKQEIFKLCEIIVLGTPYLLYSDNSECGRCGEQCSASQNNISTCQCKSSAQTDVALWKHSGSCWHNQCQAKPQCCQLGCGEGNSKSVCSYSDSLIENYYSDQFCTKDPCKLLKCKHKCSLDMHGQAFCYCQAGYYLKSDRVSCAKTSCISGTCKGAMCMQLDDESYRCFCPRMGFTYNDGVCCDNALRHNCFCAQVAPYFDKMCTNYKCSQAKCEFGCTISDDENDRGSAVCTCPEGMVTSSENAKLCVANHCLLNNGLCSHGCTLVKGRVKCSCPEGLELRNPEQKICCSPAEDRCYCPPSHDMADNGTCLYNPCKTLNGGCSHYCYYDQVTKKPPLCFCPAGYTLAYSKLTNDVSRTCIKDRCLDQTGKNPLCPGRCVTDYVPSLQTNGIRCMAMDNCFAREQMTCPPRSVCAFDNQTKSSSCVCPSDLTTIYTLNIFSGSFGNRACCLTDTFTGIRVCNCSHGQIKVMAEDGGTCVPDKCAIEGHSCSHFCRTVFEGGSIQKRCFCKSGYLLAHDGTSCCPHKDPNCKCQREGDLCCPDLCDDKCSHGCLVKKIGMTCQKLCTCPPGMFLGKDGLRCWQDQCLLENGGCHHICHSNEGIIYGTEFVDTSTIKCTCFPGYSLASDGRTCHKIDLCYPNNGGCVGSCTTFQGRKVCSCDTLMSENNRKDSKTISVDSLADRNGTNDWFLHGDGHTCCNSITRTCVCNLTSILSPDGLSCLPNPCSTNNGGCADSCKVIQTHVPHGICVCKPTYFVGGDRGKSCCKYDGNKVIDCYCAPGYVWMKNGTDCVRNPCLSNNGKCSQVCKFNGYNKICSCYPNFYLSAQKSCCPEHSNKNLTCACTVSNAFNPTSTNNSCIFQGCSAVTYQDRCSQTCYSETSTLAMSCKCRFNNEGDYRMSTNDKFTCNSKSNPDLISCPLGKLRDFDGKCRFDDFKCHGFGYPCAHSCSIMPPDSRSSDTLQNNNYVCSCFPGYVLQDDKRSCCTSDKASCYCVYPALYSTRSKKCENDPCLIGKGGCAHICKASPATGNVECACNQGYTLGQDKKSCCQSSVCECGQQLSYDATSKKCIPNACLDKLTTPKLCSHYCSSRTGKCECPKDLVISSDGVTCLNGDNRATETTCKVNSGECLECPCPSGFQLSSDAQTCVKQATGGQCLAGDMTDCSDTCEKNEILSTSTCKCKSGAYLHPDRHSCCVTSNEDGSLGQCRCSAAASPSPLQNSCLKHSCKLGLSGCAFDCIKSNKGKICTCPTNFTLGNDGHSCFYDHCLIDKSKCTDCIPAHDKIVCTCQLGWWLGKDQRICCPVAGSTGCVCPKEFYLCHKNTACCYDPCKLDNGGCSDYCKMGPEGQAICTCRKGATLKPDGKTCDCTAAQECGPKCQTVGGKSVCQCQPTFLPSKDNKICLKDACLSDRLACPEICSSVDGKIVCSCATPNKILGADGRICYGDTCSHMKCSYKCKSNNGVPECLCPEGKYVGPDKLTCIDDPCFAIKCSHNCTVQDDNGVCSCLPQFVLGNDEKTCFVDNCIGSKSNCQQICVTNLTNGLAECSCSDGYFAVNGGKICIKDECVTGSLKCEHVCKMDPKALKPICGCFNDSFIISSDGTHCFVDGCKVNKGGCAQRCVMNTKDGTVVCSCDGGLLPSPADPYACCDGSNKNCKCNELAIPNKDRTKCFQDTCKIGGSTKGECSQRCRTDDMTGKPVCYCDANYLIGSDKKSCWKDLCQGDKKEKCQHKCTINLATGNKVCTCPEGEVLNSDARTCVKSACEDNIGRICGHFCVPRHKTYYCTCKPGYYLDYDNSSCCEIETGICVCNELNLLSLSLKRCYENFCLQNNANCSSMCMLSLDTGDPVCTCPVMLRIDPSNNKTCINDPCVLSNGDCQQLCSVGMFKDKVCSCFPGFILGDDKLSCHVDACAKYNGACAQNCKSINGLAQCNCDTSKGWRTAKDDPSKCCSSVTGSSSGMVCQCNKHLSVVSGDGLKCFPDLCKNTLRGGCQHYCNVSLDNGSKSCKCRTGYILNEDGYSCSCKKGYTGYNCDVDRDECAENDNDCDPNRAKCINTLGSYNCECKSGYKGDGRNCQDIDECARISCTAHASCFNYEGGFQDCTCEAGYYLDPTKGTACYKGENTCEATLSFDPQSYSEDMGQKMHSSYYKFEALVISGIYATFLKSNFPSMRTTSIKDHKRISSSKVIAYVVLTFEGNQFPEESNIKLLLKENLNQQLSESTSLTVVAVDLDCPGFKVPDPLKEFVAKPSDHGIRLEWVKTDNVAKIIVKWGVFESAKPKYFALTSGEHYLPFQGNPHGYVKRALPQDSIMEIDAKKNTNAEVTGVKPSTTYSVSATPVNKIGYGRSQVAIVKTKDHILALGAKKGGNWLWIVILAVFLLIAFTAIMLLMVYRKKHNYADSPFEVIIKQKFRKLRSHKDHKEDGDKVEVAAATPIGIETQAVPGTEFGVATPVWDDYDAYYKYDTDYDYYGQTDYNSYSDPYYTYGEDPYYDYDESQDPYSYSQQASSYQDPSSYNQYDPSNPSYYNYGDYTPADTTNQSQESVSSYYNYSYDPSYGASSAGEQSNLSIPTEEYPPTTVTESGEGTYQYPSTDTSTVVDPSTTYAISGYENDTQQYTSDAASQEGYYDETGAWHYNNEAPPSS